ncbi:MAG: glycosyltransferase family 2 protein [Xanthomonadales bacterium]|nr:glycosyltransferase family 2 protein [Xanthomonadales bacterium]
MNAQTNQAQPRVSVIIAVYNGGTDLEKCLAAVRASTYPLFECILVDDASTDGMVIAAAERHNARVIRLEAQGGPARARNIGVKEAGGDIILFTDADVLLQHDTIAVAVNTLQTDEKIAAVIGSYDDQPTHAAFISQYRNLFHHWVHQTGADEASTFWTGCGAIRRSVFLEMGGFSQEYRQPSIEDIELGMRMRRAGYRIRLLKKMFGKHMKQWGFWNTVRTDILMRGVPWMQLVLSDGKMTNDLNLNYRSRIATVLAALLAMLVPVLLLTGHGAALLPVTGFLLTAAISARLFVRPAMQHGKSLVTIILALLIPLLAYWLKPDILSMVPVALLLALVATHQGFYRFVANKRSMAFAIAVVPMQFVFFLGCAVSIPLALLRHHLGGKPATADEFSKES